MAIGNFTGTLMIANLHGNEDLNRSYRVVEMSVSVKEFRTYFVYISNNVEDSDGRSYHPWIAPARLKSRRFTNILLNLECDKAPRIMGDWIRRQANVKFVQVMFPKRSSHLERWDIMYVRTLSYTEK